MNFIPYIGFDAVQFGMKKKTVEDVLGAPKFSTVNLRGEAEEFRGDFAIRYDVDDEELVEVSFEQGSGVIFDGVVLYETEDLTEFLMSKDPSPVECLGFLIFLKLGIAASGFHDGDEEQRAISIFRQGRWDSMKERFVPYRYKRNA